jgi:hypothetical protein
MANSRLRLVLHVLVNIVNRRGQVSMSGASKLFDMSESVLDDFIKILVENKVLEMEYSVDGEKILRKGELIKTIYFPEEIRKKVDEVFDAVDIESRTKALEAERILNQPMKKLDDAEV